METSNNRYLPSPETAIAVEGEILPPEDKVIKIIALPNPFTVDRVEKEYSAGLTLLEILEELQPKAHLRQNAHIWINNDYIHKDCWRLVRPKPGTIVRIRSVPLGGGNKDMTRIVLALAVMAASWQFGGALGWELFGGAVVDAVAAGASATVAYGTATAIGTAIIAVGGMLAINAIAPPAKPKFPSLSDQRRDSPTLYVSGARNQVNPFGVIPKILGRHRIVPPYGAKSYTEIRGKDQWIHMLFCPGYGPLEISQIKIGETPIDNFDDVQYQVRQGYPDDPPITLYTNDVDEESLTIKLTKELSWQQRTTRIDTEAISVDITFGTGLVHFNKKGRKESVSITVEIQYRLVGEVSWTSATSLVVTDKSTSAVRANRKWDVAKGQYEVRLRRLTADSTSDKTFDEVTWTALRSIAKRDPILKKGVAKIAVSIRASDQLNGPVDELNCVVHSIIPHWTGGVWNEETSSDCGSLYRHVLQGPGNKKPLPDSRIDFETIQEWSIECQTANRTFNMVIDFPTNVQDVLEMIAAAGRASPSRKNGLYSVVMDRKQTVPVQHFTPANSWGFSSQKAYTRLPHAWRIRFVNEDENWGQDERIVYDDGFDENTAEQFQGLELPGVTNPDNIYKDGRYHIATLRLRPEIYKWNADVEHILCTRGDLVVVNHDVPLWGLGFGRIKSQVVSGSEVVGFELNNAVAMENNKIYVLRIRRESGLSEVHTLITQVGEHTEVSLDTPLSLSFEQPDRGDLFMFGVMGQESTEIIVRSIRPGRDLTAELTGVDASPAIHSADTGDIPPFDPNISTPAGFSTPAILSIRSDTSTLIEAPDGSWESRILVTFLMGSGIDSTVRQVQAQYKVNESPGPYRTMPAIPIDDAELSLTPVEDGVEYMMRFRYIRAGGEPGPWSDVFLHTVEGKSAPPSDIEGFLVSQNGATVAFKWESVEDLDLFGYEIKYSSIDIEDYETAMFLTTATAGTEVTTAGVPPGKWRFYIRAIDTSRNYSANYASMVYEVKSLTHDVIFEYNERGQAWPGLAEGVVIHPFAGITPQSSGVAADDGWNTFDQFVPNPIEGGTYTTLDKGLRFLDTVRTWATIRHRVGPNQPGEILAPVILQVRYSTGEDDSTEMWSVGDSNELLWEADDNIEPMWATSSDWVDWTIGDLESESFAYRLVFRDVTQGLPTVIEFTPVVDILPQKDSESNISISPGGATIQYNRPFHTIPFVTITPQGGAARVPLLSDITEDEFTVALLDESGVDQGGTFSYKAETQ